MPEAFAGYARDATEFPVEYPTACSPQAWATGAPLLLLRTVLGLEPVGDQLLVDPALPRSIGRLELSSFDVIVMPSGSYGSALSDDEVRRLKEWIRAGGTLSHALLAQRLFERHRSEELG